MCCVYARGLCVGSMTVCFFSVIIMFFAPKEPMWLFITASLMAVLGLVFGFSFAIISDIRDAKEKYYCVDPDELT